MKLIKFLFILLLPIAGFSQKPPVEPTFMGGGVQRFYQFLTEEIDFPKVADEKTISLKFSLDAFGTMNNITLTDFKKQDAADDVNRVLKKAPKWDVSNQKDNLTIAYSIKLIFEKGKVKGETRVTWGANSSVKNNSYSSPNISDKVESDIYNIAGVESKPDFPGGLKEFYSYIGKNFRLPDVKGLAGKVFVSFVIEKDGSVTDIKVIRDIGYGTKEEAIRVLQNSPKWIPGEQNGKKVRVLYGLPISIQPSK